MNDTTERIESTYRELLMRRSGAERLAMGCRMFDAARRVVRASLGDTTGTDFSPELKVRLFLRIYGQDFDVATRDRIASRLRARSASQPDTTGPGSPPAAAADLCSKQ